MYELKAWSKDSEYGSLFAIHDDKDNVTEIVTLKGIIQYLDVVEIKGLIKVRNQVIVLDNYKALKKPSMVLHKLKIAKENIVCIPNLEIEEIERLKERWEEVGIPIKETEAIRANDILFAIPMVIREEELNEPLSAEDLEYHAEREYNLSINFQDSYEYREGTIYRPEQIGRDKYSIEMFCNGNVYKSKYYLCMLRETKAMLIVKRQLLEYIRDNKKFYYRENLPSKEMGYLNVYGVDLNDVYELGEESNENGFDIRGLWSKKTINIDGEIILNNSYDLSNVVEADVKTKQGKSLYKIDGLTKVIDILFDKIVLPKQIIVSLEV